MNYTAFAQVQTRSTKFSLYFNIIALLGIHSKVNPRNKGAFHVAVSLSEIKFYTGEHFFVFYEIMGSF